MLIKYATGFIIALKVDEKFLDVESHLLMSVTVTGRKAFHPVTFYAIQISALSPHQKKDFLASLKLKVAKMIFLELLV